MIGFAESFLTWLVSTILPTFAGLSAITWASKKVPLRYIVAFAFGILFWFFVDTISGSAVLDVNSGFGGGLAQVGVVLLFVIGVVSFYWVDNKRDLLSLQLTVEYSRLNDPLLLAIPLGI